MKPNPKLAPVVIFVYNRLEHTKKTIESLLGNYLSSNTDVFIFSDNAKSKSEQINVQGVRNYIHNIEGFKSLNVIKRNKNHGLSQSIITGVLQIVNEYGKIIVLEDDIVTSPNFLKFMNDALDYYENSEEVWHISSWNYPISDEGLDDAFLWRTMNCWGWATWKNKWKYFNNNSKDIISKFSVEDVYKFNLEGHNNFWEQVLQNYTGAINTWAIFWYATIYLNNGLCLNVTNTLVSNIGFDGSGVNCGYSDKYKSNVSKKSVFKFIDIPIENKIALEEIKLFYKTQIKNKILGKNEFEHQYYLDMAKTFSVKGENKMVRKNIFRAFRLCPLKSMKYKLKLIFMPDIYLKSDI